MKNIFLVFVVSFSLVFSGIATAQSQKTQTHNQKKSSAFQMVHDRVMPELNKITKDGDLTVKEAEDLDKRLRLSDLAELMFADSEISRDQLDWMDNFLLPIVYLATVKLIEIGGDNETYYAEFALHLTKEFGRIILVVRE
ncbi:MAG: hypothetical protein QMD50_03720 [Patescibacteria group bacterium]|nr:hypothetical protein [Patescibacteria group bacterium]